MAFANVKLPIFTPYKSLANDICINFELLYFCPKCNKSNLYIIKSTDNILAKKFYKLTTCECKYCNEKLDLFTAENGNNASCLIVRAHYAEEAKVITLSPGYVFSPYVPLMTPSVFYDPQRGIKTRYSADIDFASLYSKLPTYLKSDETAENEESDFSL